MYIVKRIGRTARFGIYSPYSPRLKEAARSVPGMSFDWDERAWIGYCDAVAAVCELLPSDHVDAKELTRRPLLLPATAEKGLRDYQIAGSRFLVEHAGEGAILADSMRLGKTAQAATAARALKRKTVVICPSHVVGVWERELTKWWPKAKQQTLESTKPTAIPEDRDVVIIHYDVLYAWVVAIRAWCAAGVEILDEGHMLQDAKSRRSAAARAIAEVCTHRMVLSGTPMTNRPRDLHNVVETISPGRFGNFFGFAARYCNAHQFQVGEGSQAQTYWNFDGRSNEEELHSRLQRFMLRRLKNEVDHALPPKTRQILEVNIKASKAAMAPSSVLLKGGALRKALDLAADGKVKHAVNLLQSHATDGEKVIAFCWRRKMAEHLTSELTKKKVLADYVHGELPRKQRDKRIEWARETAGPLILLCTIDSCSTGIDLSFAGIATFVELTYEPLDLLQAEERIYKFGETRGSLIQYLIARGSGDELIAEHVVDKLGAFEAVIGPTGEKLSETLGRRDPEASLKRLYEAVVASEGKRKR
jgi:SWI/SNF-related matrix-associated actin-dependent regulator of chromatin subfamily A-like protein 1